jgi:fucose permease
MAELKKIYNLFQIFMNSVALFTAQQLGYQMLRRYVKVGGALVVVNIVRKAVVPYIGIMSR